MIELWSLRSLRSACLACSAAGRALSFQRDSFEPRTAAEMVAQLPSACVPTISGWQRAYDSNLTSILRRRCNCRVLVPTACNVAERSARDLTHGCRVPTTRPGRRRIWSGSRRIRADLVRGVARAATNRR